MLDDALRKKVQVRSGDRIHSVSKIEAALDVAVNQALKGDRPILRQPAGLIQAANFRSATAF